MSKRKAKLVTAAFSALFLLLLVDLVGIYPGSLPYILLVFAIPGAFKFVRTFYIWLVTEDYEPIKVSLPFRKRKRSQKPSGAV